MLLRPRRHDPTLWLLGALALPLQSPEGWRTVRYSGIPENKVEFSASGMRIDVDKSASPIFFGLKDPISVSRIHAEGIVTALPALTADKHEEDNDDYALRIGLVVEGDRGLSWLEKIFAPKWLRELSRLADGKKLDRVFFYSISQRSPAGTPLPSRSKYTEQVSALQMEKPGRFELNWRVEPPKTAFAVWLQADGDDTQSTFTTQLRALTLEPAPSR